MIGTAWIGCAVRRTVVTMHSIWIEIPALDLSRAASFYRQVFGHDQTEVLDDGSRRITIIEGNPTVSLNATDGFVPGTAGPLPYFTVGEDLDNAITRVEAAGGQVIEPKTPRGEFGYFALVLDSEGNHLYLHGTG